ncbi:hypothetical protein B9G98_01468 [Wickerhamiella sorbophila]|uniref:Uncharacterized protein n=1 Tax=Wickerhamiella sorbophila TaxID=45607 RepID=A0A2T0FFS8_9ASCO|nr:hypothetical protein B9G98_01468 [Wickerhamiella sorbophila]PRT53848.1 hypothetical protein B9G98_01468 [Wickerhamiella sorbophila]
MKLVRGFSVKASPDIVRVLARVALPARPRAKPRAEVLEKLDASLLHESLNARDRRLVFRPSKAYHLEQGETVQHKGRTLQPMKYPGLPSVADLSSLVETSTTAADLDETWEFFKQYHEYENSRVNLRPEQFSALIRKSAEIGELPNTIHRIFGHRTQFSQYTTPAVFSEALRLYALLVPYLSRRAKNTLYKIYYRAEGESGRELPLLYGIVKYGEKFGTDDATKIKQVVGSAVDAVSSGGTKGLNPIDIALGLEAAKLLGPVGEPLAKLLDVEQNPAREEQELVSVRVLENPAESVEPEGQAPLVEEA